MKSLHELLISSLIGLILLTSPHFLHANEVFKQLTINNGLAHTDANCLTQDSTGLIWIGTYAGLQSYDGYSLKTFDYYPNGHHIYKSHNRIRSMACDREKLWLGTESGLTCFDLNTHRYIPYYIEEEDAASQLFNEHITELFINPSSGHLWLKTPKEIFIAQVQNDTIRLLPWNSEAERIYCKGLNRLQFKGETVWGSAYHSLLQLSVRNGKVTLLKSYTTKDLFKSKDNIRSIYLSDNQLYVRSGDGCYRFSVKGNRLDVSTAKYINFRQLNPKIAQTSNGELVVSRNGTLWCSYLEGVFEVRQPFSPHPIVRNHLRSNRHDNQSAQKINALLIDNYNNLWIATNSWGVYYQTLSKSLFKNIWNADFQEMGFSQNEIVSVTGQDNGTIWMIVEYASLFNYRPQTEKLSAVPVQRNLSDDVYMQTIIMSRDQRHLYIGTSNGILIYDTQTQQTRPLTPTPSANAQKLATSIAHLAEDEEGQLWVGAWGKGLLRITHPLTNPRITLELNMQTDPKLLSGHIASILIRKNDLFLCTTNGLNRIRLTDMGELKSVSSYQANPALKGSLSSNYMASIDYNNDSVCWIGTIGGGLNKVVLHSDRNDDYTATNYTVQDGLVNNDCEIVMMDNTGNVWIGGNGLAKLDVEKNTIYTYGYADGLQSNAFKINVSFKSQDGAFFMGGLYGLNYFYPDKLTHNFTYNGLMLTELFVNNRHIVPQSSYDGEHLLTQIIDKTSHICLNHLQNNFTITFAALGYELSDRIVYRYRLKGFQNQWQTLRYTNNEIYFSNLPYDSYELEIQLSTDKGNTWHEPGRNLFIEVTPPWWLSAWAKLGYSLLSIALLIAAFRQYNHEQNLKKENEIQKILMAQDEERYQTKMQFFMNASHELKTPLTLILLSAEKLIVESRLTKECKAILYNTRKMLSLITELVDIRKVDLGIGTTNLSRINISQLVQKLYDEINLWADNKHITISYTPTDIDIELNADSNKMGKLIINLFSNAIKYTNEGGRIDISFHRGTLKEVAPCYDNPYAEGTMEEEQPACILIVKDTGVGISAESIRLIYERFFQVKGSTESHLGTGIGLAIVKSIVLQHKGVIIVSSQRGTGTEFIVVLPIHNNCSEAEDATPTFDLEGFMDNQYNEYNPEEENLTVNDKPEIINTNLPTLLIVEDNKELQIALKQHFSTSYNVYLADNGRTGLEKCLSIYPDIIVSDVMMPEMDGIEMCRRIKNNLSVAYIPLVLLTAKDNVESQIEGYESGADLYIPKPFSMRLLEVNLNRLLKQREQWFKGDKVGVKQVATPDGNQTITEEIEAEVKQINKDTQKSTLSIGELEVLTEQLKKIIIENLSDSNLSPDQLANAMGVSRTKLYRDLKRIDGQSLSDYVRNVRLEKAACLLTQSTLNIQEIMNEVGFINSSHFTKIFKLKYGMTPTEYKTNH